MISSPYCAVSVSVWASVWASLHVTRINVIPYELLTFSLRHVIFFIQQFLWFVVSPCDIINNIHNGGWHETLNLRHVSSCRISPKLCLAYLKTEACKKGFKEQSCRQIVSKRKPFLRLLGRTSCNREFMKVNEFQRQLSWLFGNICEIIIAQ